MAVLNASIAEQVPFQSY